MLHFRKIPKKMVKFGENSAKFGQIWANLRNFGKKTANNSAIFNENFEIRERTSNIPETDISKDLRPMETRQTDLQICSAYSSFIFARDFFLKPPSLKF